MIIKRVLQALWQVERTAVAIHLELCCRNRHRLSTCTRCLDSCPAGALKFSDGLQIDLDRCSGCGICATVCPTGAMEARAPSDEQLLEAVKTFLVKHRVVVFSCSRNSEWLGDRADETIHVPCLGRVNVSLLVATATAGAEAIYLLDAMCETCRFYAGHQVTQKTASRASQLLQAIGAPLPISLSATMPEERPVITDAIETAACLSRRAFFREFLHETSRIGAVLAAPEALREPVQNGTHLSNAILPAKRRLLLEALWKNAKTAVDSALTPPGLWNEVVVGEDCSVCHMCAYFCPTDALSKDKQDDGIGISFRAARCVACNLCVDICYKKAINVSDQISLERLLDDSVVTLASRKSDGCEPQPGSSTKMQAAIRAALGL
ncbi:MAG: 4Fe-4S binding protein [Desulfobulbaceae bacterium]|nr:4Fe-4S binding protein [Desulfobulbaceae bacterium]